MIRVTRTVVKPNENTNLASFPEELSILMLAQQASGNLALVTVNVDGLSNTFVWKWKNRESYETYINNPVYINARSVISSYNIENNIQVTEVIEELDD